MNAAAMDFTAIAGRVQASMTEQGIGVRELGRRADLAPSGISSLLKKPRALDLDTLTKLATGLSMPLQALLGEAPAAAASPSAAAGGTIQLRHGDIRPSPLNPRKVFDAEAVASLAANIGERGLLQPLVVRHNPDLTAPYELAAGERRWRAIAELIKAGMWPADRPIDVTVKALSDLDMLALGLSENVLRRDMHPLEEGEAFAAYVDQAGGKTKDLAESLGLTQRWAQIRIALARKLSARAKKAFLSGRINLEVARALTLGGTARQDSFLKQHGENEHINADWVRRSMTEKMLRESAVAFDLADYTGEISEGDEARFRYLLDDDQAQRLQAAAIEAMLEKARKAGWSWVETHDGYLYESSWAKSKDKTVAGALLVLDSHEKPRLVTGLVKPADAKRLEKERLAAAKRKEIVDAGGNPDAVTADDIAEPTKAFHIEARRRKTAALRDRLVTSLDRLHLAMQVVCIALLGGHGGVKIKAEIPDTDDRQDPAGALLARLQAAAELIGGKVSSSNDAHPLRAGDNAYYMTDNVQAALWQRLDRLDGDQIQDLFITLVAARVGSYNGYNPGPGDTLIAGAIAASAGIRHAPPLIDEAYLKLYRKPQLVDLAIRSGVADEGERAVMMKSWTATKLRGEILACTFRDQKYVPPELVFTTPPPIDLDEAGEEDRDLLGYDDDDEDDADAEDAA